MLNRFKLRHRIAAGAMSLAVMAGLGVTTAGSASAAGGVTPKCSYSKTYIRNNPLAKNIIYNVVAEQYALSYPRGYKMCHVVQTRSVEERTVTGAWKIVSRSTIYDGWIKVRA